MWEVRLSAWQLHEEMLLGANILICQQPEEVRPGEELISVRWSKRFGRISCSPADVKRCSAREYCCAWSLCVSTDAGRTAPRAAAGRAAAGFGPYVLLVEVLLQGEHLHDLQAEVL